MAKRPWSRAFTPKASAKPTITLSVSRVPPTLREKFARKCRTSDPPLSQRNLILSWIANWVAGRRPDEPG